MAAPPAAGGAPSSVFTVEAFERNPRPTWYPAALSFYTVILHCHWLSLAVIA